MNSSLLKFLSLILLISLASGCQNRPPPSPDMTRGTGPGTGMDGDYIDGTDVAGSGMPAGFGLEERDPRYGNGEDARARQQRGVLESVYFDFDSSNVRSAERPKLQAAYAYLNNNPEMTLLIEGHCDWRGTAEYNLALGDRRAASVRNFLVDLGIDSSRIETLSKGDLEASVGGNDQQMQQDRRAELIPVRPR